MSTADLLLIEHVAGLGGEGDQVKVKAGYARNYLLPRRKAVPVTMGNRKQIEALQKRRAEREAQELQGAQELAKQLGAQSIAIAVKTGEGGKIYGSVTAADVFAKLQENGIELNRKKIQLNNPIRSLGSHSVRVKLHPEVAVELNVEVVSENPIEEQSNEGSKE